MPGPKTEDARYGIEAWMRDGLILEKYRYGPGLAEELPGHSHDEYQICLSLDFPGVYRYRGASHTVPMGSLSVIHPGEVHSARDPEYRRRPSSFRMMYADPAVLAEAEDSAVTQWSWTAVLGEPGMHLAKGTPSETPHEPIAL